MDEEPTTANSDGEHGEADEGRDGASEGGCHDPVAAAYDIDRTGLTMDELVAVLI